MEEPLTLSISIPDSILPYPEGHFHKAKFIFWKAITPFFTDIQELLLALHVIRHEGRQEYILGSLAKGRSANDFLKYLESNGFGNHFIAWKDDGQLAGLRRLDGFEWQYHLRIFKDGEIRGHYEHTPEAYPIRHLYDIGMEPKTEMFTAWLGDWVESA